MKGVLIILCLAYLSFHTSKSIGHLPFTPLVDIVDALKTGNANRLSKYFDDNIGLTIQDKAGSYSRSQAKLILTEFFSNNTVKNYVSINTISNSTGQCSLGILYTETGAYQVSISIKQIGGRQLIQQMSIDKYSRV
jgi:hypothetical protein